MVVFQHRLQRSPARLRSRDAWPMARVRRSWQLCLLLVFGQCFACPGLALAQLSADTDEAATAAAPDSPRASLSRFLELSRAGNYVEAARYLELTPTAQPRGALLARRLQAVLEQQAEVEPTEVSGSREGNTTDNLPAGVDELAQIPGPLGNSDAVQLVYRDLDGGRWIFPRHTVDRIDPWYSRLKHRWLLDHLPGALLRSGPGQLLYWQWIALPLLLLLASALGYVLSRVTRRLFRRIVTRTESHWDDEVLARVGGPLTSAWALSITYLLLPWLGLEQPAEDFVRRGLRALLFVIFFWSLGRSIDVAQRMFAESKWAEVHSSSRSLLPLATRVSKVVLLAIAVVALLSELGYPVASLIAGLGIGGLAVALAAQKTLENLFGAFSLGADQPFRPGDFVRVEDFVATVEEVGLRSTRFRTLDRTLITIPNGKLAEMRLESYSARDRLRLACTIGVVYGTSAPQLRQVLAGFERVLRDHPLIWVDSVNVYFKEFGDSALNIEVMAWFRTSDWSEFQLIRQETLLKFMEVVANAGSAFAFPTRTLHLVNEPGTASSTPQALGETLPRLAP